MKVNKNKMTEEQRKVYEFIESNVPPANRMEATLLMGHLSFIQSTCKEYLEKHCFGCPFYNEDDRYYEPCLLKNSFADEWQIEKMIKNIFSNLN